MPDVIARCPKCRTDQFVPNPSGDYHVVASVACVKGCGTFRFEFRFEYTTETEAEFTRAIGPIPGLQAGAPCACLRWLIISPRETGLGRELMSACATEWDDGHVWVRLEITPEPGADLDRLIAFYRAFDFELLGGGPTMVRRPR